MQKYFGTTIHLPFLLLNTCYKKAILHNIFENNLNVCGFKLFQILPDLERIQSEL